MNYFLIPEELYPVWTLKQSDVIGQTKGPIAFSDDEIAHIKRVSDEFFALQKKLHRLTGDEGGFGPIMCNSLIEETE